MLMLLTAVSCDEIVGYIWEIDGFDILDTPLWVSMQHTGENVRIGSGNAAVEIRLSIKFVRITAGIV
ncbi:hypothetical protein BTJ40_05305 [Microbulbifer sp. A4B17]|nr:hypothetical protein BTJ40_05305 [Microbulbifer sp. A4B17]